LEKIEKLFNTYKVRITITNNDILKLASKLIKELFHRDDKNFPKQILSKLLDNKDFLKSVLIVAVEIVLFIGNVEELCFYKLAEAIELDLYEFWKILNPIHLLYAVPSVIRVHFSEIEVQLFTFMIWRKPGTSFKNDINNFNQIDEYFKESFLFVNELKNIEFHNQSLFVYFESSIFTQDISMMEGFDNNRFHAYNYIKPIYVNTINIDFL
jgi:hypothetical protein